MIRELVQTLERACLSYNVKYKYSSFFQLGLCSNKVGLLKADVVAINFKRQIVIQEIKSNIQDFRQDKKWYKYRKYCNKLYFVFDLPVYTANKQEIDANIDDCGILCLVDGFLKCTKPAKSKTIDELTLDDLIFRMAYRAGESNRTRRNSRV